MRQKDAFDSNLEALAEILKEDPQAIASVMTEELDHPTSSTEDGGPYDDFLNLAEGLHEIVTGTPGSYVGASVQFVTVHGWLDRAGFRLVVEPKPGTRAPGPGIQIGGAKMR